MRRAVLPVACVVVVGAVVWLMMVSLQSDPIAGDDLNAIILRAPNGYVVQELGAASFASAAEVLQSVSQGQTAARFTEHGDTIILFADRSNDRVVEMRASRTGTIVERHWHGAVDRRLAWAAEHGDLNTPGLPAPTGKNLYH